MPIVQFLESLASVKYNQKMDCFNLGKKRMAIEPNAIAPQKYSDFFDNKPMVLPEPQGVEGSGSSCMPFKNRTMMPVSSSSFSSAGTHSRTLSAPSQLYRSGYDRMPLPSVGSCNAVPSQIWPISETRNECFQSAFVEAGRAIGSSNCGYRKASSFSKSITSKGRPTSLPPRKHEAHPLPLPVPQKNLEERFAGEACDLGSVNIIVSSHAGVQASLNSLNFTACTSDTHRLPLPSEVLQKKAPLRKFTYEELSSGCRNFSSSYFLRETSVGPVYRSLVKDTQGNGEKMTVAVTCLKRLHLKDEDEWISYMTGLAKLDNPYLCRLSGFCNLASFDRRKDDYDKMLVFEHMENESLDRLLLRKQDEPPLGWFTRLKIALGTAKGLAYLYDKSPFQGFYEDFNMSNVQIDKDCTPKLSDYGLHQLCGVGISLPAFAQDSRNTVLGSSAAEKNIVRSFGKVLLGLLSARKHLEKVLKGEGYSEQLVKVMRSDTTQTESILDPVLQGHHIARSVRKVLNLALQCLQEDAVLRPQIQDVVKMLSSIQRLKSYDITSIENSSKGNLTDSDGDIYRTAHFKWRNVELSTQPMYELPKLVEDTSFQEQKSPLLSESHRRAGWQPSPGNSNSKGSIGLITWAPLNIGCKPPASSKIITNFSCASSFLKQKMGLGARRHKILQ